MPSFKGQIQDKQCLIDIHIQVPPESDKIDKIELPPKTAFRALIDTGAQSTCISAKVATQLGLIPIGKTRMQSASGTTNANVYDVNLLVPITTDSMVRKDGKDVLQREMTFKRIPQASCDGNR